MKYVRTVYNIVEAIRDCGSHILVRFRSIGDDYIPRTAVVQGADGIDELLDEWVCDERLIARFSNVKETIKRLLREDKTIYGAIWTEWGLKYVAKLTEEGWELL